MSDLSRSVAFFRRMEPSLTEHIGARRETLYPPTRELTDELSRDNLDMLPAVLQLREAMEALLRFDDAYDATAFIRHGDMKGVCRLLWG